jgi:hypothetical protein
MIKNNGLSDNRERPVPDEHKTKPLQQLNADFLKKEWTYEK